MQSELQKNCIRKYWIVTYVYPLIKEDTVIMSYIGFTDKDLKSAESVINCMNLQVKYLGGKYSVTEYYK